ncbi:MAG: choice-of-anchor H family protein [Proteobacteria bacterium]|nr:choice-of-anchor H family protein [Pseudomonadota bacterium]
MVRSISTLRRSGYVVLAFVIAGMANVSAQSLVGGDDEGKRLSLTTQFTKAQQDRGDSGTVSADEFSVLATAGDRSIGKHSRGQSKAGSASSMSPNTDFWFYSADVVLFNDHDQDGYYYGIDLLFDADTYYAFAEVYAVVYLSLEGGPWNEYAATENFDIFGASGDDEYVIVTELLSGYPSGSYDILIELFDTFDDSFVASFGPIDTSELAFLPLEDANRDTPQATAIIINEHGGGSLGWLTLLVLLIATGRTASRRWLES